MHSVRPLYLDALGAAMTRLVRGDADAALQAFLSLNAGYFLGEWLPEGMHERLVRRLAQRLDGLADLGVPGDETAALQLAQHARELAAAFEPTPWTERIAAATAGLVPVREPHLQGQIAAALKDVAAGGDGAPLLRLHATRRLWALTHPTVVDGPPAPVPAWALTRARRAAASADGREIQLAEAALAELAYGAVQSAPLDERAALLDPEGRQHS
jgi:hypothetical protein